MEHEVKIQRVTVTHPDKILFRNEKISKEQVIRYYDLVAPHMLEELRDRPLTLVRCTQGVPGQCFFQKHVQDDGGGTLRTIDIKEKGGALEQYVTVKTTKDIIELAQLNTIEFHGWGSRGPKFENPDRMIFDLDPSPEVPSKEVIRLALRFRDFLKAFSLNSFPRLSGGKGIHLVVPLLPVHSWDDVRMTSEGLTKIFARDDPLAVTELSKRKRVGKVFIDYLRNGRGATAIANYSLRAREKASIAVPLQWEEVTLRTRFDRFTLKNIRARLDEEPHPWASYTKTRQTLPDVLNSFEGKSKERRHAVGAR